MNSAQRLAFQLGSGADAGTVLLGIAAIVLVLALIWAMWITFGAFRSWQDGAIELFDVAWSALRVSILLMVLGYYIR